MKTILVLLGIVSTAYGAYCNGKPDPVWSPNTNPLCTEDPVFVKSVQNGKLYTAGCGNATFTIAHVYGTPYEMGYAHGQLLKEQLEVFIPELWVHLEQEFYNGPDWVPPAIADYISQIGLDVLLDLAEIETEEYTPSYWFEEMKGLADGVNNASAVTFQNIYRLSLLGELTKGTCSMFGVWGDAIANVPGLELLQLRALDWDTDGPFPEYPLILVYHPNEGHAFANVGWPGWIGGITGMSEVQTAISEIGIYFTDETWGTESVWGYPFTYVLRDLLQFDNSTDDATNRLANSDRTCAILMGFGDGKASEFRGYQYDYSVLNVYDDVNLQPLNDTWHPRIKDIVYWGMDWLCPGYNVVLADQLKKFYGNITAENTMQYILPAMQTGATHVAIYDLTNQFMYYASVGLNGTENRNAFERPYTKLDMQKLFAVTAD